MKEDEFISGLRAIFEADPTLKPAKVAREAGLNNSSIRKMFDGSSSNPTRRTMEKIAAYFGTTVEAIAHGTAVRNPSSQKLADLDSTVQQIVAYLSQLTDEEKDLLLAAAEGLAARHRVEAS